MRDPAEAQTLFKQAYEIAASPTVEEHYKHGMLKSLVGIARADMLMADYHNAMIRLKQTLMLAIGLNDAENHYLALYTLGELYIELGNYSEAYDAFRQQMTICKQLNDTQGMMRATNGMGRVSAKLNNYHEALAHFEQVSVYADILQNRRAQAVVNKSIAAQLIKLGRHEEAIQRANHALTLSTPQMPYARSTIHQVLGHAYTNAKQYEQAREHLEQALHIAEANKLHLLVATHRLHLGWVIHLLGDSEAALDHLHQALDLSSALLQCQVCADIHERISAIYEAQGDYASALTHYKYRSQALENAKLEKSQEEIERIRQLHDVETLQKDRDYYERLATVHDEAISNASHDLKTPLTRINLAVYSMRRRMAPILEQDPDNSGKLTVIEQEVEHIRQLIDNLLDLVKHQNNQSMAFEVNDLNPLLKQCVQASSIQANHKSITLTHKLADTPLKALVEVIGFKQMMDNLLSNAIKFTPEGGHITLTLHKDAKHGVITLHDTGPGIPPAELPHIFDRFYRAQTPIQTEGSGLGLAIVKSIADKHHADIEVISSAEQGTTFIISVPLLA